MLKDSQALRPARPAAPSATNQVWKDKLDNGQSCILARVAVRAGAISQEEVEEAVEIAGYLGRSMHDSVDSILLKCDHLNPQVKQLFGEAVQILRRNILTEELAVMGMTMALRKKISFAQGLRYFGWGW